MSTVTRQPAAPVTPPETYSITGLTRDEMLGLHALLGGTHGSTGNEIYTNIGDALRGDSDFNNFRAERAKKFPDLTGKGRF